MCHRITLVLSSSSGTNSSVSTRKDEGQRVLVTSYEKTFAEYARGGEPSHIGRAADSKKFLSS